MLSDVASSRSFSSCLYYVSTDKVLSCLRDLCTLSTWQQNVHTMTRLQQAKQSTSNLFYVQFSIITKMHPVQLRKLHIHKIPSKTCKSKTLNCVDV